MGCTYGWGPVTANAVQLVVVTLPVGCTHGWDPATANAVQLVVVTLPVGYALRISAHSTHGWGPATANAVLMVIHMFRGFRYAPPTAGVPSSLCPWVLLTVGGLPPLTRFNWWLLRYPWVETYSRLGSSFLFLCVLLDGFGQK